MGIEADLVIRGGAVIDGTGRDPIEADVAVEGRAHRRRRRGAGAAAGRRSTRAAGS